MVDRRDTDSAQAQQVEFRLEDAARYLQMPVGQLLLASRRANLETYRVDGDLYVSEVALEKFLEECSPASLFGAPFGAGRAKRSEAV